MEKQELALNNQKPLICHKTQPNLKLIFTTTPSQSEWSNANERLLGNPMLENLM